MGYPGRPARRAMPRSSGSAGEPRREFLSSTASTSRVIESRSTRRGEISSARRSALTASSWRPRSRANARP